MVSQLVFQDKKEIERLKSQCNLFLEYETPVIDDVLKSKEGKVSVLDVGCNEGDKTVSLFSADSVEKVIGLEYNKDLAEKAQSKFGDDRFSFYSLDVESDDFLSRIGDIMKRENVEAFDVIYLSVVLLHLKDPDALLLKLKPLLKDDGTLVIVEGDDSSSFLVPDEEGLLKGFLEILNKDKYSGNRTLGKTIEKRLVKSGYIIISLPVNAIAAGLGEREKKKVIYTVFFSYLKEDVAILLKEEKDNEEYKAWAKWLRENSSKLEKIIKSDDSYINMGMKILVCHKGLKKDAE